MDCSDLKTKTTLKTLLWNGRRHWFLRDCVILHSVVAVSVFHRGDWSVAQVLEDQRSLSIGYHTGIAARCGSQPLEISISMHAHRLSECAAAWPGLAITL
jgi:hypothetical protein